ncbi:hypothetical protein BSKO_07855 [Bryopsis sp. KO-2023]|nr:hypothetical protein BSKO_07855 [Bryopsis sp. KO-2023]
MRSLPNAAFSIVTWLEKRGKFVQPELTRAQKRSLLETFHMIDTDGSGSIERRELLEAFLALGLAVSSQQIDEILGAADSDGSGSVDFMEFLHLMTTVLKSVQDVGRDSKQGGTKGGMPLQLLATAYRRRKTLEGVMNNNTFRRRLIFQNEGMLAREETVRLTRRRMSIRQRQTHNMGMELASEPRYDVSRGPDPPRAPSSSSSSTTSSKQRQRQQPITGLVLEIDVGLDFSDDSEDFHTPYWKTRRLPGDLAVVAPMTQ